MQEATESMRRGSIHSSFGRKTTVISSSWHSWQLMQNSQYMHANSFDEINECCVTSLLLVACESVGFDYWAMKMLSYENVDNLSSKCWDVEIWQGCNAWKWECWIVDMWRSLLGIWYRETWYISDTLPRPCFRCLSPFACLKCFGCLTSSSCFCAFLVCFKML